MMNKKHYRIMFIFVVVSQLVALALPVQARAGVNYLYHLSNFNGPVSSMWARIAIDPKMGEIYTLNRSGSAIQVFNEMAMQIYGFGENLGLAAASDITATDEGDVFVLYRSPVGLIRHLDYRGDVVNTIRVGAEAGAGTFNPDFLDYQDNKLYLADSGTMQVVVTTISGDVLDRYDFGSLIVSKMESAAQGKEINPARLKQIQKNIRFLEDANFGGFCVDAKGNLYFSISSLFVAYRFTPGGKLESFGIPGSAPGKFGVVASIAADNEGNIYVSDRLRSVVLMFDRKFNFLTEFGYRGSEAHNLIVPDDLAIDEKNSRLYVAQAAKLGVSVFNIQRD